MIKDIILYVDDHQKTMEAIPFYVKMNALKIKIPFSASSYI